MQPYKAIALTSDSFVLAEVRNIKTYRTAERKARQLMERLIQAAKAGSVQLDRVEVLDAEGDVSLTLW